MIQDGVLEPPRRVIRLPRDVKPHVPDTGRLGRHRSRTAGTRDIRSVPLRAGLPVDKADLGAERLLPADVGRSGWRRILAAVNAQALREFDLLPTRLMGDSPEIFAEVDKTRAEAEFRLGIVPPLFAVVLVACIKVSWFWAFAFPALGLLLVTGLIKRREAGDQLAQAIQLGKVDPPVLEKLRSLVQEKVDEAKSGPAKT